LCCNGIVSLVVYHGGDTGFKEKDSIVEFVKSLDHRKISKWLKVAYNINDFVSKCV